MGNFSGGRGFGDRRDNRDRRGGEDRGRGRSERSFGGGRRRDGGRSFSRDNSFEERRMYSAICDNCGKECKVPFKPTGEKPVYCSDCFEEMGNGGFSNRHFNNHEDNFVPFKEDREETASPANKEFMKLSERIEKKLDAVITLLEILTEKKTVRIKKKTEEVA